MSGDVGLFGPDSVTWKLHREPILLLGGLRSLYLQALHPRAVAGVAQNSGYRADPWGRLIRTSDVRRHGRLRHHRRRPSWPPAGCAGCTPRMSAVDPRTGERFRIDEPDLLRWVHVAEVESFLTTATRAGVRLTPDEVDALLHRAAARPPSWSGLDPATVPATAAEVAAYYDAMRPELSLTKDGVETALFLTVPPVPETGAAAPSGSA